MMPQISALTISDLSTSIDNQPRIYDLRLAEALGFERPRKIRELIERHKEALERFGEVSPHRGAKPKGPQGGRPSEGYALNKKQALYLCTKSDTPNATDVTIAMVEVFDAYVTGRTEPRVSVKPHTRRPRIAKPATPVLSPDERAAMQATLNTIEVMSQQAACLESAYELLGTVLAGVPRHKELYDQCTAIRNVLGNRAAA